MNDWLTILKQLGVQIAPWVIVVVLALYILRARLSEGVNALLDWLGTILRGAWSYRRFERIFRPATRAMHLYMRVVGIRFEKGREPTIPEAYVPLHLAPYVSEEGGYVDQINRQHTVGSTLADQSLLGEAQNQSGLWSIEDILQRHTALVVLGDPGAGKSTLLKYLVICFTEPRERERARNVPPHRMLALKRPQQSRPIVPCPLYVPLRSCQARNDTLLKDILDPETKILAGMLPSDLLKKIPQDFIEHCVRKGRAILLLDGLDEVANEEMYTDVVRKINDFLLSYPRNLIVVTCRIAGWRSGLRPDFTLYQALPLDRQQQHDFIARWYQTAYKQNDHDVASGLLEEERSVGLGLLRHERELSACEEANALERLLHDRERLAELAANPMLLSLICLVYHLRRDLPRGRAALYEECVQILLGVWDRIDKGLKITKPTMDEKRKILRHVAYMLHTGGQKDINRQDFVGLVMRDLDVSQEEAYVVVRQIEVRSWLIVERVIDRFAFSHLTLQEFFVVEYLRIEQHGTLNFDTIKDWNIWYEPILLMCGKVTDPTTFIEGVTAYNAALGLLCITEADSTALDLQRIDLLLDRTLQQAQDEDIALVDLIPALVSLLGSEKPSFAMQVTGFLKTYFQTLDNEGRSRLITTIASRGTREAARLLLYIYQAAPSEWPRVLEGLLLISDPAVDEVLQCNRRGELSDTDLREFLLHCYAPEATRVLWERYGVSPQGVLVTWAESWACRLTLPENEQLVRAIPYDSQIDFEIWPYRKSQHTALAAIAQRCVQILRDTLKAGNPQELLETVERIAKFDLRVQIPLLIRLNFPSTLSDSPYPARLVAALGLREDRYSQTLLQEYSWFSLIATGGRRAERERVLAAVGTFELAVCSSFLWAGTITLLWHILATWLAVTLIVVLLIANISCIIYMYYYYGSEEKNSDGRQTKGFYSPLLTMAIIAVLLWTVYIAVAGVSQEVARFKVTKKVRVWLRVWYLLLLLLAITASGILGGFAIQAWVHLALPLSMLLVGFFCLLVIMLLIWQNPFSSSSTMFTWLTHHPCGRVVLDEFVE